MKKTRVSERELVRFDSETENIPQTLEKYPKGKVVTVYYDSDAPYYSTLEMGPMGSGIYWQLGALLFVWAAFVSIFWFSAYK